VALDALIGSSKAIRQLRQYLPKLAASNANVLITGETGTGKERVAEIIHRLGPRKTGSFVCVNCAAVPDALFESEMFGHEAGAFTGALRRYEGKLRMAAGGTIFLDEIGEMSLLAQGKILRALESREVSPLGSLEATRLDVRFIAATNQELEPLVKVRAFRQDLFYRLNVARVHLQPLRERKEDIPDLFGHFVAHFNQQFQLQVGPPSAQLLDSMLQYEWPGNVREIRNLVEALFIDPPLGETALHHLPESFRRIFERFSEDTVPERDRLLSVLHQTNWNKKQAAIQLNWSRMTLYRKMAKYHINRPPAPGPSHDPEA
jgi:transcriptional regulator with PAS, ATPase and Fis domain